MFGVKENKNVIEPYLKIQRRNLRINRFILLLIFLLLFGIIVNHMQFIVILGCLLIVFIIISFKLETKNVSLNKIILEDCNVSLWKAYIEYRIQYKKGNQIENKLVLISCLLLNEEFELANKYLKQIDITKLNSAEFILYYYSLKNDYYFYTEKLSELIEIQKNIENFNYWRKKVRMEITHLRSINQAYLYCLEKDNRAFSELILKVNTAKSMLAKVKYVYALYLLVTNINKKNEAEQFKKFIVKNGGNLFFVEKVKQKSDGN